MPTIVGIVALGCDGRGPVITAVPIAPLACAVKDAVEDPEQAALLRPVVSARTGSAAATVLAGPSATDPTATIVVLCTEATDGLDSVEGSLKTSFEAVTEDELTFDVGGRDDLMSASAGRGSPRVARVELTLASGATVRAIIAEGYWLAVWQGSVETGRIIAIDDAGKVVASIEP